MTTFTGEVHPLAEVWPMLDEEARADLAQSIAEHGLREPIALDSAGRLVDGRNRLACCRDAGVEPVFVTLPLTTEEAIAAYIQDRNAERRHLTAGQQAMGRALMLQAAGKRRNGRWERGSLDNRQSAVIPEGELTAMRKAGLVLDVAARAAALGDDFADYVTLPQQVMAREATLDFAYRMAQAFEGKAALAEAMKTAPLTEALAKAEVILDDLEALTPLPELPVPLTKQHRQQLDAINRRARQIAAAFSTYAKEAK